MLRRTHMCWLHCCNDGCIPGTLLTVGDDTSKDAYFRVDLTEERAQVVEQRREHGVE